jgi:hypothetical protein
MPILMRHHFLGENLIISLPTKIICSHKIMEQNRAGSESIFAIESSVMSNHLVVLFLDGVGSQRYLTGFFFIFLGSHLSFFNNIY